MEKYPISQRPQNRSEDSLWDLWASRSVTACVVLGAFVAVIGPFTRHLPMTLCETDDFFYYLKIAVNLSHGAGSTFNGIVATNGYHPLWLLLLASFTWFTTAPQSILVFIACMIFIATLATYFLARILVAESGVHRFAASALAAYITLYSIRIFYLGMEIILTIPLILLFLVIAQRTDFWQRGVRQSAVLGLVASAMILSRLDTALLVALIIAAIVLHSEMRSLIKRRQQLGLLLGLTPVLLYFVSNRLIFHVWLPVSGMAKQLKFNSLPSAPAWKTLIDLPLLQLVTLLPIGLAIFLLPLLYRRLSQSQQVLYPAVLVFPIIHIFVLSCVSDWKLWIWYFYSFRPALCVSFAVLCLWKPVFKAVQHVAIPACVLLFIIFDAPYSQWEGRGKPPDDELQAALSVEQFSVTHPGIYALGDRAGTVGYLLKYPLIQLEGLVMDRQYLGYIQRQTPLRSTLAQYKVRYYIATERHPFTGCFRAVEPFQAGSSSPHMVGNFCEQPVAVFQTGDVKTVIFDLQPSKKDSAAVEQP